MSRVSVIIPCYNHGKFIIEAVESVLKSTYDDFEIIIVDDGSTDGSQEIIRSISHVKVKSIFAEHQGVSSVRNLAINAAVGEYILPLDADDKISSDFIEDAVNVLDADHLIGVVYSRVIMFGEISGEFVTFPFSFESFLLGNVIVASAFFRKKDWEAVNGYDVNMRDGLEDWEFWVSLLYTSDKSVKKIDKEHFFYRQHSAAVISRNSKCTNDLEKRISAYRYVFSKHIDVYRKYGISTCEQLLCKAQLKICFKKCFLLKCMKLLPVKKIRRKLRAQMKNRCFCRS